MHAIECVHAGLPHNDDHLHKWGQAILPGLHHVRGHGQKGLFYGLGIVHQRCRGDEDEPGAARAHDEVYIRTRLPLPDEKLQGTGGHHGPSS
eukprot:1334080-Heterocapsa_arctica.AAC.1